MRSAMPNSPLAEFFETGFLTPDRYVLYFDKLVKELLERYVFVVKMRTLGDRED